MAEIRLNLPGGMGLMISEAGAADLVEKLARALPVAAGLEEKIARTFPEDAEKHPAEINWSVDMGPGRAFCWRFTKSEARRVLELLSAARASVRAAPATLDQVIAGLDSVRRAIEMPSVAVRNKDGECIGVQKVNSIEGAV